MDGTALKEQQLSHQTRTHLSLLRTNCVPTAPGAGIADQAPRSMESKTLNDRANGSEVTPNWFPKG